MRQYSDMCLIDTKTWRCGVVACQAAGYWSQLEITLFTTSNSASMVRTADSAVAGLDQHSLKVYALYFICSRNTGTVQIKLSTKTW